MKKQKAFTIIELLVVIVIIGILAAIGIVSYSSITSKTSIAVFQSDLSLAKKQIMNFQVQSPSGLFPTSNNCVNTSSTEICLKSTNGYSFNYVAYNYSVFPAFYLTESKNNTGLVYSVTESSSPSDQTSPISNGLIVYLDASNKTSYQSPNMTWYDLSGNGNNSTLYNGVGFSTNNGGVLVFDKIDDYAQGNLTPNIPSSTGFTTITWFNATTVISEQHLTNVKGSSQFYIMNSTLGTYNWGNLLGGTINANTWYMGSISKRINENSSLYLNDVEVTNGVLPISSNSNAYVIGNYIGGGNYRFGGNIAISLIYNRALSVSEVAHNFNVFRSRFGV